MKVLNVLPIVATSTLAWHSQGVLSFAPSHTQTSRSASRPTTIASRLQHSSLSASIVPQSPDALQDNINNEFWLSPDEVNAFVKLGSEPKQKIINPFGVWCLTVSLLVCPIWFAALQLTQAAYNMFGDDWDPNREFYDGLGKIWAKSFLTMTGSYPSFSGELDLLEKGPHNKPCLFVANHASWLDIPVLCSCTDQVFKFIAKGELGKLPCIGDQLTGVSSLSFSCFTVWGSAVC